MRIGSSKLKTQKVEWGAEEVTGDPIFPLLPHNMHTLPLLLFQRQLCA